MAARFWVPGGTGIWTAIDTLNWSATSGGAGGASVPGSGDTATFDGSSGGGTVTVGYDPSVISITGGAFTGTLDFSTSNPTMQTFSFSGAGTRTLNYGSGNWTVTGNNTTVWTTQTTTNLTTVVGTATINFTYAGSTGTRTIIAGAEMPNLSVSAGSDVLALGSTLTCANFNLAGFTGNWNTSTTLTVKGNFALGTGMTVTAQTGVISMTATSGTKTITSNGVTLNRPLTFNGVGGTFQLADAYNGGTTRALTLTNGTFNANGFNVTCGSFSSSNANIRTLTPGSGVWTLTGNATTIYDTSTSTNLTVTANTATWDCNYAGATGTRLFNSGAASGVRPNNVKISAGTDTFSFSNTTNSFIAGNLDFTGFGGTHGSTTPAIVVGKNITLSATMTNSYTGTLNPQSLIAGTYTITTNGIALAGAMDFRTNNFATTYLLADDLFTTGAITMFNSSSSGGVAFDTQNHNITCASFNSSNSNTRTITMGTGTWTLTGTGIVLNLGTSTNLTLSSSSCTILVTDTSSSSKTFSLGVVTGGISYGTITVSPGGSGAVVFTAGATMTIAALNCAGPKTLNFTGARTYVIISMNINGTAGNLVTLASSTPGSQYSISVASGLVEARYVAIQDSIATGGAYFQAINSTDNGNNTGWNFVTAAAAGGLSVGKKFAAFGGARPINKALDSKLHGYRKLGG